MMVVGILECKALIIFVRACSCGFVHDFVQVKKAGSYPRYFAVQVYDKRQQMDTTLRQGHHEVTVRGLQLR